MHTEIQILIVSDDPAWRDCTRSPLDVVVYCPGRNVPSADADDLRLTLATSRK